MSFSGHADRLDEAVMLHLADTQSATYTPSTGDPIQIPVIVERDIERTVGSMQGAVMERRTELSAYAKDLSDAYRGETVTVGSDVWKLVSKFIDDGGFVTWIVKLETS